MFAINLVLFSIYYSTLYPMTMASIGMAAVASGLHPWRVMLLCPTTAYPPGCHFSKTLPLQLFPSLRALSVCFPVTSDPVDLPLAIMSSTPSASGLMETDKLLPNDDRISTKVIEETFDIKLHLPDKAIPLATTPYLGLIGTGNAYLQPDLDLLMLLMARVCGNAPMLTEAQLTQCHTVGLSSTEWLMAMAEMSCNRADLEHALTDL